MLSIFVRYVSFDGLYQINYSSSTFQNTYRLPKTLHIKERHREALEIKIMHAASTEDKLKSYAAREPLIHQR